jgi:hypothetical protein
VASSYGVDPVPFSLAHSGLPDGLCTATIWSMSASHHRVNDESPRLERHLVVHRELGARSPNGRLREADAAEVIHLGQQRPIKFRRTH